MSFLLELVEGHIFTTVTIIVTVSEISGIIIQRMLDRKTEKPEDPRLNLILVFFILLQIFSAVFLEVTDWSKNPVSANPSIPTPAEAPSAEDDGKDEHDTVETYILVGSMQVISEEALASWDDNFLYLLRNGLYARAGRIFYEEELMEFYEEYDWYNGYIAPQDFEWDMLNNYQKRTILNIKKVEESRKY